MCILVLNSGLLKAFLMKENIVQAIYGNKFSAYDLLIIRQNALTVSYINNY